MSIREVLVEAGRDRITDTKYVTNPQMSGAEIAKAIEAETGKKITRQAISNTLKRAMKKTFLAMEKDMRKHNEEFDAFDVAVALATGWEAANTTQEMQKFFKLFPPDIRKRIEADAKKRMPGA